MSTTIDEHDGSVRSFNSREQTTPTVGANVLSQNESRANVAATFPANLSQFSVERFEPEVVASYANEHGLSPREAETLQHLVRGCSIKRISSLTGIGFQTIAKHRQHLLRKIDAANEVELVLRLVAYRRRGSGLA